MNKSFSFNWCGDRSSRARSFLETLDKDDKEEKKYSAEEKEVDEGEVKKSVSERKREIERRISEEQDKKKEPQPVPVRSESKDKKDFKEASGKVEIDSKYSKDELSKSEKETCEEKSVSPEPANLTFDEKRRSFELGSLVKDKSDKKVDPSQKFLDSEKLVYQMVSDPEPELTFQEKRLSFEKGLVKSVDEKSEIVDSKTTKKMTIETIVSNESAIKPLIEEKMIETTKETKLFEGVTKGLTDFKEKEKLSSEVQGIVSPRVSTTPPPSPADVLKAKAGEEWKSTPTSDTERPLKTPAQKPDDESFFMLQECQTLQELPKELQVPLKPSISDLKNIQPKFISPEKASEDKMFESAFVTETGSPSIFRRPHQAADFVIFDDEDWDTQDIVEFSDVTAQILPGNIPYVPEKFLEDSSKGELHQERVQVFEKPFDGNRTEFGATNIKESGSTINVPPFSQVTSQNIFEPVVETKTIYTTVQTGDLPGDITVTKVETERIFQPFPGQSFSFNDFSQIPDSRDADSINDSELNFPKSEVNINADDTLKFIVDFAESCKTSSEDLRPNIDKSETENLVEIVDVTEELNAVPLGTVSPSYNLFESSGKSDLLKKLDDCLVDDFKLRPKTEKNKISNISPEKELDNKHITSPGSALKNEEPKQESIKSISFQVDPQIASTTSSADDSRNGRYLGSGGESISTLEDELNLLEKLEDQIKMLKEEEAKMKVIKADSKLDNMTLQGNVSESKEIPLDPNTSGSFHCQVEKLQEETNKAAAIPEEQIVANEDIVRVMEEAQNVLSSDKGDEATGETAETGVELFEEKTKKKKNRKRRSKKAKEDLENEDTPFQTSEEHQKQTNSAVSKKGVSHSSGSKTQNESERNSEREFQRMVSQLSVEEVDEAMQIWNQDLNPFTQHLQSEREEEQSSSSDQKSKPKDEKK